MAKAKPQTTEEMVSELYRSLDERYRPEDVADVVLSLMRPSLSTKQQATLNKAARISSRRHSWASGMSRDFDRPTGLLQQIGVAEAISPRTKKLSDREKWDTEAIQDYVRRLGKPILRKSGQLDFKADRLDKQARRSKGLDISKRQYNKRFRLLRRMELKLQRLDFAQQRRSAVLASKSRLASKLTEGEFSKDVNTATFISYYVASCNKRSVFTPYGQDRPYDEIAEMLFRRCARNQLSTNWWAIAHVYTNPTVMQHLTNEQKGTLLAESHRCLQKLADMMRTAWEQNSVKKDTMIVSRGNDSDTWNVFAGAWNKLRDHWFSLLADMRMYDLIENMCPGKAMRLMAADVARWAQAVGKGLHPDTFVWAGLPFPWEVLSENAECTADMVRRECKKHGVDPQKSGWTPSVKIAKVQRFKATPELVHGVVVGDPDLATKLRKMGVFSAKKIKVQKLYDGVTAEEIDAIRTNHYDTITSEAEATVE